MITHLFFSVEFDAVIALMLASILMQIWTMIFGAIVYRRKKHLMIVVAVFQALTGKQCLSDFKNIL